MRSHTPSKKLVWDEEKHASVSDVIVPMGSVFKKKKKKKKKKPASEILTSGTFSFWHNWHILHIPLRMHLYKVLYHTGWSKNAAVSNFEFSFAINATECIGEINDLALSTTTPKHDRRVDIQEDSLDIPKISLTVPDKLSRQPQRDCINSQTHWKQLKKLSGTQQTV